MKYVICTIIKDELLYLKEWIDYNISIGFDAIYLYEDDGSQTHKEITDLYNNVYLSLYSDIPKTNILHKQMNLFSWFINEYKDIHDWCAFIDVDEFIKFDDEYSLDDMNNEFNEYNGVLICQKTFGANGYINRPNGKIDELYNNNPYSYRIRSAFMKSIVNLNKNNNIFVTIHRINGGVFTNHKKYSTDEIKDCYNKIWYNHYYTRSWEEWLNRFIKRGDVVPNCRKISEFFLYNPELRFNNVVNKQYIEYLNSISNHMQTFFDTASSLLNKEYNNNIPIDIDYVFPYVTTDDQEWIKSITEYYNKNGVTFTKDNVNFREWGLLKYYLRGISECLPFIRNVYMIVSSEMQIPSWINRNNIKIVFHSDIIPEEQLPTFNSTTIEMYLHKIEGLSDHFIYGNDDMYSINKMYKSDFFGEDLKPKTPIRYTKIPENINQYQLVLINCMNFSSKLLSVTIDNGYMLNGNHSLVPMYKPIILNLYNNNKEIIDKSCSKVRLRQNYNQLIWNFYFYLSLYYNNKYSLCCKYTVIGNADGTDFNLTKDIDVLCLNDSSTINKNLYDIIKNKQIQYFEKRFPNKCIYEK